MIATVDELLELKPYKVWATKLPENEIIKWFELLDACWIHSGDPKDPHAELTSNWCSNGFFDCLRVLKYVNLSEILARQLAMRLKEKMEQSLWLGIQWVIGSPMAAITFSHDVARAIGAPISMSVEKNPAEPKKMIWKRMVIPEGAKALQIEELITTAHTLNEVERAVREGNPCPVDFIPYIGTLVHRPPKMVKKYGEREVVAVIEKEIWAVPPEECPLCKQGSKRLRPKTHWKELMGKV